MEILNRITKAVDIDKRKIVLDGCMVTYSGLVIDLFNINPDLLLIEDIAHGLANNSRWNGHTKKYYSIAEHTLRVKTKCPKHLKFTALMHDSEEAYWGDMIKPLKEIIKQKCPEITDRMRELRHIIFDKFKVPDRNVKDYDFEELLYDFEFMILSDTHIPLSPRAAETMWLREVNKFIC